MLRRDWMLLVAFLAVGTVGCGGSGEPGAQVGGNDGPPGAVNADGPARAVTVFLEAVRGGDDEKAAEMFTNTARREAAAMNIQVAPRGSDTARFAVGNVEYVSEKLARVQSTWTDVDENGAFRTDEMAWMLRLEPQGWRVAGMAATVFQGEPPLLLDFENPEETLQKLQLLRKEIERRTEVESLQAQQPRKPEDSALR